MIVSDFVAKVILKATGKVSTSTSGDAKWLKVLGIANTKIDDWANEPEVDWGSLYSRALSIGTVTATDTFPYNTATIRSISQTFGDPIRILHTDGKNYTDYDLVPYDTLKEFPSGTYCAVIGGNLVFNNAFQTTDPQFGGTINVPAMLYPSHLVNDTDVIPVDIPNWLVMATAAEYVRTDVTRQNQYANLAQEANQIMERMKDNNDGQVSYVDSNWAPLTKTWL